MAIDVTCTIAADDYVMGVKLIHDNGFVEDLTINHEGGAGWKDKKSVTFEQSGVDEQGALIIQAKDFLPNQDHCYSAGLVVHCTASDEESQWDNFGTNTDDWYSEDGNKFCSDTNAAFLTSNVDWISQLIVNGAKNIWVEGQQVVNLVGTPWREFPLVTGKTFSVSNQMKLKIGFISYWRYGGHK